MLAQFKTYYHIINGFASLSILFSWFDLLFQSQLSPCISSFISSIWIFVASFWLYWYWRIGADMVKKISAYLWMNKKKISREFLRANVFDNIYALYFLYRPAQSALFDGTRFCAKQNALCYNRGWLQCNELPGPFAEYHFDSIVMIPQPITWY